jgi:cell division FtsZ-interacting protein ZapD
MNLATDFERLDEYEGLRAQISSYQQRLGVVDILSSNLLVEVDRERNRAQQYLAVIEDKTREIDKLAVALRTADDEASQERERQHVLIARLRASVRLKSRLPRDAHRFDNFFYHCWPQFRRSNDVPRSSSSK